MEMGVNGVWSGAILRQTVGNDQTLSEEIFPINAGGFLEINNDPTIYQQFSSEKFVGNFVRWQ